MNKVVLMGRLTKDAEVRTSGETSVARFTLAVDRRVARNTSDGSQTADFINCVGFNKKAEFLDKFGKKGTKFVIEGRIQTGSYENKDGNRIYTTDVVIENIEFAESKSNAQNQGETQNQATDNEGFMNIPEGIDEELPFV